MVKRAYKDFDYKRIFAALSSFMTSDLSAFYFDIRKDSLYCDPISSVKRKASLTVIDHLFRCTVTWLAPMLCFTAEESWLSRYGADAKSVHLEAFPEVPAAWRDDKLAEKWRKIRIVRGVVTGALEIERAQKRIGSSLEAHPIVYISNTELYEAVVDCDLAECASHRRRRWCRTRARRCVSTAGSPALRCCPSCRRHKCARSWKILTTISRSSISGCLATRCPGVA